MSISWKWMAKTVIQKAVSIAPEPDALNHRIQALLGRGGVEPWRVRNGAEMCRRHLESFERVGLGSPTQGVVAGSSVLELGTGWNPVVPVLMWLCGADRVISIDHVEHASDSSIETTAAMIHAMIDDEVLRSELACVSAARAATLGELVDADAPAADIRSTIGLERLVGDVTALRLEEPVDAVVSNLVLEHIPVGLLPDILRGCFDLLAPGGVMSHVIDLCDHGHYIDPDHSQFNYLRFSDRQWRFIGNSVQHESRLRASQYVAIFESAGIPIDDSTSRLGELAQLERVPVAERFGSLDVDDLLVVMLHLTSIAPS